MRLLIGCLAGLTLLLSACTEVEIGNKPWQDRAVSQARMAQKDLPTGYGEQNMKQAIDEYINYILWSNAASRYDSYIGRSLDFVIRNYRYGTEMERVYAYNAYLDEWLALEQINGTLYCTGNVEEEEVTARSSGYETLVTISLNVAELRNPEFGDTPYKEKILALVERRLSYFLCQDYVNGEGGDQWEGTVAYIRDFYEFEDIIEAWYVRNDDVVAFSPIGLQRRDGELVAFGVKGYEMPMEELVSEEDHNWSKLLFERSNTVVVKSFTCETSTVDP